NKDLTWTLSTIRGILWNRTYTGALIWNRSARGKFNRVVDGQAQKRGAARRTIEKNAPQDLIIVEGAQEAIVSIEIFLRAHNRHANERQSGHNFRRGRGKNSPFLLTSLLVCKHCGFKLQAYTHRNGYHRADGTEGASF